MRRSQVEFSILQTSRVKFISVAWYNVIVPNYFNQLSVPPQEVQGLVSDEGTVVQFQHLQSFGHGCPGNQVSDTDVGDALAVRQDLKQ